jgi:hypothetical protein
MRGWVSVGQHAQRVRARVLQPAMTRVDRVLARWGL